ncbi:sensor histidine kinase [Cohnella candidum]|uniref:Sensor histidine kinase n=1 Tax=Cohnella candidum TaxID=2674991 RepID=A0A3G3K307_9BACL|nr:sensor histidine kinase [Cohnella candidum]AYQ74822.1 sensor histidine kinase [Cohnella candidum]
MNAFSKPISIRTLLLSIFLLLMIFPMVVITFVTYKKENQIFQDQVSQFLAQTVEQTGKVLDANLTEIDRLTWSLLYQRQLDFLDSPLHTPYQLQEANRKFQQMVYFDLFRGRLDHIQAVYFVTPDKIVLSTDNTYQWAKQMDEANYRRILDTVDRNPLKMFWFSENQAAFRPTSGFQTSVRDSVVAVRKLIDSNTSALRGYLFVQLNDRFLADTLASVRIGSTGALLVTGPDGEAVYRQDAALLHDQPVAEAVKSLPAQGSGTVKLQGKWLLSYVTSDISGWKMTAVVPLHELLGANQQILKYLLVMAVLGTVIFVAISILLATALSKPVIQLARLMSVTSLDHLHVRDIQGSVHEIGILQRNFNRLMDRIQQLMHDNERKEKEKRDALLQTLQMQIHPHFLYNTLDTIYWMSKKHQAEPISKLVAALGKFFRFTLNAGQEWTTLDKEFGHLENYLLIQSFRYRDRVRHHIELDPAARDAAIIPLLLQPLVENALEHGISNLPEGGVVRIEAKREGEQVAITIFNSGNPLDAALVDRILHGNSPNDHVGLRNVQSRVQMAFGPEYGLALEPGSGGGTLVTLIIPYKSRLTGRATG